MSVILNPYYMGTKGPALRVRNIEVPIHNRALILEKLRERYTIISEEEHGDRLVIRLKSTVRSTALDKIYDAYAPTPVSLLGVDVNDRWINRNAKKAIKYNLTAVLSRIYDIRRLLEDIEGNTTLLEDANVIVSIGKKKRFIDLKISLAAYQEKIQKIKDELIKDFS